jgi:hypothetical protein
MVIKDRQLFFEIKCLIILAAFLSSSISSHSQIITGSVLDKSTGNPIRYAALYFTGTFVGTTTDDQGHFELNVSKNLNMPLKVSAIGFYSVTLNDFLKGNPLIIYMEQKVYELGEVVVRSKSLAKKRKANLIIFRNIFIGTSANARNCFITNENDITFNYSSDRDTLKAYASRPLEIENRSLGYRITYYLDKFEFERDKGAFIYRGDMIYREDLSVNSRQKQIYNRRRRSAYLGSRMHFFRALWENKLHASGFYVEDQNGRNLSSKDIVLVTSDDKKYFRYFESLQIEYYSNVSKTSLQFLCTLVPFDPTGYYDESCILWEGDMAERRIADWLPYEYYPEK